MKTPSRLLPLVTDGLVDAVLRQLMSGKEAMVYVVQCGDELRCAKVYKEARQRSFRQAVDYTEGRRTRNSRQARAMAKGSRYGRQEQESAWQSAEVDALYRLAAAGVRVPTPYNFHAGVLLMELLTDAAGRALLELDDHLIDRQAFAGDGDDLLDLAVALGLEDVLHLHRFDHRQFLAGGDRLSPSTATSRSRPGIGESRNFERSGGTFFGISASMRAALAVITVALTCLPKWTTR
jgi:hypothetical protein